MSVLVIGKCPSASACRVPVRAGLPGARPLGTPPLAPPLPGLGQDGAGCHRLGGGAWAGTGLGWDWAGLGLAWGTEERACAMRIK